MANMVPTGGRNRGLTGADDFYNMIDSFFGEPWFTRSGREAFRLDVQQKDNEYLIEAELPGVNRDEVDIDMADGNLQISVRREEKVNEEGKNYIHRERRYSSMSRSVYLADGTSEGIRARLDNGVLKIYVPRQERAENTRRIEIE